MNEDSLIIESGVFSVILPSSDGNIEAGREIIGKAGVLSRTGS